MTRIVIVGGSLAGTQAAQAIRRAGFDGDLVMVGDEPHYPYDRPPLSKNYLVDEEVDEQRLRLRPTADPEALGIDWRLGRAAVALHTGYSTERGGDKASEVELDDGERLTYDGLIIATGARPRRLPGADSQPGGQPEGVCELRTLDDARILRAGLSVAGSKVVVCGAGFIGAEVASSARERGLDVTLIDAAATPLDRVLDPVAGMAVADLHREHGVDVRLGVGVDGFQTDPATGRVASVALSDGSTVPVDLVIVGIGVVPNTEWLAGSSLVVDNGVVVDETCQAGPGIVAAGDVARWPNPRFGGRMMRVEQWDNAVEMGMYAGKRLLHMLDDDSSDSSDSSDSTDGSDGQVEPFAPVPWFWSDQYDRKIQLAGVTSADTTIAQGSIAEHRFVQLYGDADGMLVGALCWNRPRQAIQARQLIAAGETMAAAAEQLG